jgi:hypothetical protein
VLIMLLIGILVAQRRPEAQLVRSEHMSEAIIANADEPRQQLPI